MTLNNQVIEYWYTIQEYIHSATPYALALEGGENMGKTHFLQNILPASLDENAPYTETKFVYVSLMAVKTLEQLQEKVKAAILPIFQQYMLSIAKNDIVKFQHGIQMFSGWGFNPLDYIIEIYKVKAETSKMPMLFNETFNNIVLCLDDIEKKYLYLEVSEILAYINDLVQNRHKVIIAIDKEKEEALAQESIFALYNKVCPIRLNFDFYQSEIYQAIIANQYRDYNEEFGDFLLKYEGLILEILNTAPSGLPIQIFKIILGKLEILYPYLEHFKSDNPEAELYYEDLIAALITLLIARLFNQHIDTKWANLLTIEDYTTFFEIVLLNMDIEGDKTTILYNLFAQILNGLQDGLNLEILPADFLDLAE